MRIELRGTASRLEKKNDLLEQEIAQLKREVEACQYESQTRAREILVLKEEMLSLKMSLKEAKHAIWSRYMPVVDSDPEEKE